MSGPALKQLDAHRSIHDGAVAEGRALTELLCKLHVDGHVKHAHVAAHALVEHWETRTLAHAESEEEGLYVEKIQQNTALSDKIMMLRRDHELIRIIVDMIKQELSTDGLNETALNHFRTLPVLIDIHNRTEETILFG